MFTTDGQVTTRPLGALLEEGLVRAPGVGDALAARIAQGAGHVALYVSGGAVARSLGLPDVGLVTATEMAERIGQIRSVTALPLIVDADTGYGGPLAVARTVALFERAGAAALHIEDQADPKRCAEYGGVRLVPAKDMVAKLRAACASRTSADLRIVARTDALGATGLDDALSRLDAYRDTGADLFFLESVREEAEIVAAHAVVGCRLLLNAADLARAAIVPARAAELGCRILIHPADLQKAAMRAMRLVAEALAAGAPPERYAALLASDGEREAAVGLPEAQAFEAAVQR